MLERSRTLNSMMWKGDALMQVVMMTISTSTSYRLNMIIPARCTLSANATVRRHTWLTGPSALRAYSVTGERRYKRKELIRPCNDSAGPLCHEVPNDGGRARVFERTIVIGGRTRSRS